MFRPPAEPLECWLRCNRRAVGLGAVMSTLPIMVGLSFLLWRWPQWSFLLVVYRVVGGSLLLIGVYALVVLLRALRTPRVARLGDSLWFYLRSRGPIEVPIDIVECFFLGQGPSHLGSGAIGDAETSNIVVRLAERAVEWQHVDVKPALAHWCDGYITLNGAWCQPIDNTTLEALNHKLIAAKRKRREATTAEVDSV